MEMVKISDIWLPFPEDNLDFDSDSFRDLVEFLVDDPESEIEDPIVLHENGWTIENGHHRILAYMKAGREYIPAVFI